MGLHNAGQRMPIHFTLTDSAALAGPHTHEFTYRHSEPRTYALEGWRDAPDPASAGLASEPERH
jgi:hypothetical protein